MIKRSLALLGSLRITVASLLVLLVLTVWGTLYQADHGLYLAQERFYQSWFFLIGGLIPFPGAQLVMTVLFINLVTSMLLLMLRGRLFWGLLVTHLGLFLMLAAGAVTFYLGQEAQLSLAEGSGSNVAVSFQNWELAVFPAADEGRRSISAVDARRLRPHRTLAIPGTRYALRVETYYRNCEPGREEVADPPRSAAGYTSLTPRPPGPQPAEDLPGLVFTLFQDGVEKGTYLLWGGDATPVSLRQGETTLLLGLRQKRLPLPAVIQLVDFRREMHPGSGIAKSYASQVLVRTGSEPGRRVLISMNKPLRLQGFTFYQSSFASAPGGREISTLAVVHNYGRLMPYIATGVTVGGMLLHFTGLLITRLRRRAIPGAAA